MLAEGACPLQPLVLCSFLMVERTGVNSQSTPKLIGTSLHEGLWEAEL